MADDEDGVAAAARGVAEIGRRCARSEPLVDARVAEVERGCGLAGPEERARQHGVRCEAFAAQSLAVIRHLGLDPAKVNPRGGAIALGHPLGATGAIRTATLVHGMRRAGGRYGMVTMCIGTGMGAAGLFEMLH